MIVNLPKSHPPLIHFACICVCVCVCVCVCRGEGRCSALFVGPTYLNSLKVYQFDFIQGDDEGWLVADAQQTVGGRLKQHRATMRDSMETTQGKQNDVYS